MISIARILGAPLSVPAGKVARSTSMLVRPGLEQALDVADDVHHVRVALDDEGVGHLDAAGLRDAADVVARQVDQHQVLGALLRVGRAARSRCARSASGEAPRGRVPASGRIVILLAFGDVLVAHQDLGRRADDLEVAHVVEVHVGRRVERAQRAVQAQRRLGVALLQALADLHLHHVAGRDVLLGLEHGRDVVLLARTRAAPRTTARA